MKHRGLGKCERIWITKKWIESTSTRQGAERPSRVCIIIFIDNQYQPQRKVHHINSLREYQGPNKALYHPQLPYGNKPSPCPFIMAFGRYISHKCVKCLKVI